VLFATHYFELTQIPETWPGVRNAHVTAREWGDQVVFLHKVEPGPADRAYGIHVAKLAGVPKAVLARAEVLLCQFEKNRQRGTGVEVKPEQPLLFDDAAGLGNAEMENGTLLPEWLQELDQLNVNDLTPLQALLKLQEWKEKRPS
jgi:DNA mismatch repair protein MutS